LRGYRSASKDSLLQGDRLTGLILKYSQRDLLFAKEILSKTIERLKKCRSDQERARLLVPLEKLILHIRLHLEMKETQVTIDMISLGRELNLLVFATEDEHVLAMTRSILEKFPRPNPKRSEGIVNLTLKKTFGSSLHKTFSEVPSSLLSHPICAIGI